MKYSESWLREWVNPQLTREELSHTLTMAGLEVEEITSAKNLEGVVMGDDYIINVSITPNRGDCLSVRGLAREVSALTGAVLTPLSLFDTKAQLSDSLPITLKAEDACPHYVGRIIRGVKADATTPTWMKDRLLKSGVRSINLVVDVTNYVMLELGQPMHAFDLNTIKQEIIVRKSRAGEKIVLLDGSEQTLNDETMVIADHENPVAIAGVMGGLNSSVTLLTKDILLESAYFSLSVIAKQRQHYGLSSESAYRFERGVDPAIQREAIDRATALILESAGGKPGPILEQKSEAHLPKQQTITLPHQQIAQVLGIDIPKEKIKQIFAALDFSSELNNENTWRIHIPTYRFDITIPEDVIEEIARLYGYDHIPTHYLSSTLRQDQKEAAQDFTVLRQALSDQGYHEIISYSFVDKDLQSLLHPAQTQRELLNPITAEMTVMRTNLWPGLITTLLYNKSRQQHRIRLFEIGTCFREDGKEEQKIAGIAMGLASPEQWGIPSREEDFFDLKGTIENLLEFSALKGDLKFKRDKHEALHPGQTAGIYHGDKCFGIFGTLHPTIAQKIDIKDKIFLFELDAALFKDAFKPLVGEISKFPEIRRDIAILVNRAIPSEDIQDTIKVSAGDWLKESFIFDVYQGKGIPTDQKSIALALILQHPTRTLVDDEVNALMERVINALKGQLGAQLRS